MWFLHRTIEAREWYGHKLWGIKVTGPYGTQDYTLMASVLPDERAVRDFMKEHRPSVIQDVTNPDLWGLG